MGADPEQTIESETTESPLVHDVDKLGFGPLGWGVASLFLGFLCIPGILGLATAFVTLTSRG